MELPQEMQGESWPWRSWRRYSRERGGQEQVNFCQILAAVKPDKGRTPWPTLVLGSECLRLRSPQADRAINMLPDQLRDEIEKALQDIGPNLAKEHRKDWTRDVQKFVEQLVDDRVGRTGGDTDRRSMQGPTRDARREAASGQIHESVRPPLPVGPPLGEAAASDNAEEVDALRAAADRSQEYQPWELRLIVAAATLTQHYFTGKLDSIRSVSRWDLETLKMSKNLQPHSYRSMAALEALIAVLKDEEPPDTRQILRVATAMRHSLMPEMQCEEIKLAHLQALTEFAWDRIIRRFSIYAWYPDWPEFLVRLSMDERSNPFGSGFTRPSPRRTVDAASIVREALHETTQASAAAYLDPPVDETVRMNAYATYAELLHTMAETRRGLLPQFGRGDRSPGKRQQTQQTPNSGKDIPPPASAFITTFDVELELALASRYKDEAFVVAMPVNLVENSEHDALGSTMWLGCVIRPDGRPLLERVTRPREDAWFLFEPGASSAAFVDPYAGADEDNTTLSQEGRLAAEVLTAALAGHAKSLGGLPIIVRLAGSPLMQLPRTQDASGQLSALGRVALNRAKLDGKLEQDDEGRPVWDYSGGVEVATTFVHATLLDEHHAIRLSLPEVSGTPPRGLPRELAGVMEGMYWRYWLLLGVEMSDPVIRYRVAAQVLGVGLRADQESFYRPKRLGVVLNRKDHNARALDLLAWSGFDVVTDTEGPAPMTHELEHYLAHLKAPTPGEWQKSNETCPLSAVHGTEDRA